jgi:methionyl-tRNA synthetase
LKPRILRGIESQGMILMGKSANGALIFVEPDSSLETISGLNIS